MTKKPKLLASLRSALDLILLDWVDRRLGLRHALPIGGSQRKTKLQNKIILSKNGKEKTLGDKRAAD